MAFVDKDAVNAVLLGCIQAILLKKSKGFDTHLLVLGLPLSMMV